jgi:hypothetical protein
MRDQRRKRMMDFQRERKAMNVSIVGLLASGRPRLVDKDASVLGGGEDISRLGLRSHIGDTSIDFFD